jgi:hypothetical protein
MAKNALEHLQNKKDTLRAALSDVQAAIDEAAIVPLRIITTLYPDGQVQVFVGDSDDVHYKGDWVFITHYGKRRTRVPRCRIASDFVVDPKRREGESSLEWVTRWYAPFRTDHPEIRRMHIRTISSICRDLNFCASHNKEEWPKHPNQVWKLTTPSKVLDME